MRHGIDLRRALALLILAGLAAVGSAAPTRAAGAAPAPELFGPGAPGTNLPGEDAVVLLAADTFTLHPDGRIDHDLHRLVRLQSEYAIDALGDPRVPYDSLLQDVVVHTCRAYTPDGRTIDATAHAFNRTTPDAVAGCPGAMRRQELVISHVGIERGCVIELEVGVRDRVAHAPWLEGLAFASEEYPVLRRVITVKLPQGTVLQRAIVGGNLTEETAPGHFDPDEGGAAEIRIWRGENLPAAREADDGAGGRLTRPYVVFSTCASWDALAARVRGDLDAAARVDPAADPPFAAWRAEQERKPTTLTVEDRIAAILELTGELTTGAAVAPFEAYRAAQPAARTFETACGDDWDRAALALALLRSIGVEPEIALRPVSPRPAREVPALAQFDRVLLARGADEVLDPAGGKRWARAEDWGGTPLFLAGPASAPPRWEEGDARVSRADVAISLALDAKGGAEGEVELALTGRLLPYPDLIDVDARLEAYAGHLLPGAKLTGKEIRELSPTRARLRLSFAADTVTRDADGRLRLTLGGGPVDLAGILSGYNLHRPARTTSIVLPGPLIERVTWKIALPEGIAPSFLPSAQSVENEAGAFRLHREPGAPKGGAKDAEPIIVGWALELPEAEIAPARYAALRRLYAAYASEPSRLVVIESGKTAKR
jgi:hypothetical protein